MQSFIWRYNLKHVCNILFICQKRDEGEVKNEHDQEAMNLKKTVGSPDEERHSYNLIKMCCTWFTWSKA